MSLLDPTADDGAPGTDAPEGGAGQGGRPSPPVSAPGSPPERAPTTAADPSVSEGGSKRLQEPVWLVRITLLLFLAGFAAFLAREVWRVVEAFF